jgi:hypothetical protein
MKKRDQFRNYNKAQKAHEEAAKVAESVEAGLALLEGTSEKTSKRKLKKLAKAKEATKEALAKAQETKPEPQAAVAVPAAPDDESMKARFWADLEKALQTQETAQGAMTTAAFLMFVFYSNLLSPESKYTWYKIVYKQTEGNPYVNLQGVSLEGPRGVFHKSFNNCVMFHLLTAFPINAAEQEKYYILDVLKKPQRVNVHQFVRPVEQLNTYIAQMPCFFYSPNANASTKPENVLFTEAELGAHVLHMCPIQWQDQYNLNEKGMTPIDMHLLLTSLEVIEHVCTYKKGTSESSEKSSHKSKKGKKRPGTKATIRVPKKVCFKKHCKLCKKHGGAYTTHNTRECRRFEKDGKEKPDFRAAKKGGKKSSPLKHNFMQLTEKIEKLKKALKKSGKKGKKHCYDDKDSDSE